MIHRYIRRNLIMRHALFWVLSSLILYRLFTLDFSHGKIDMIYTILFQIPLIFVVYLNYLIADLFIEKSKILFYILGFILLLMIGIGLHYLIFDHLVDYVFTEYYFVSLYSKIEIGQYVLAYLVASLLFKLSVNWFQLKERQLQLEKDNHNSQMAVLKAQLNPHFLFNSLNNIYSLTSSDVKKGRENIVKLSDALRYMLYKTDAERVPLESELEYLNNYIELEKLRLETDRNIVVDLHIETSSHKIAPLILLPFIENCFKHCDKENPEIEIKVRLDKQQLKLNSKNNKGISEKNFDGGVGLVNAKKRLELIYKDSYNLLIDDNRSYYITELTIDLDA